MDSLKMFANADGDSFGVASDISNLQHGDLIPQDLIPEEIGADEVRYAAPGSTISPSDPEENWLTDIAGTISVVDMTAGFVGISGKATIKNMQAGEIALYDSKTQIVGQSGGEITTYYDNFIDVSGMSGGSIDAMAQGAGQCVVTVHSITGGFISLIGSRAKLILKAPVPQSLYRVANGATVVRDY